MSKQDRQAVRTAPELERKYNFSKMKNFQGSAQFEQKLNELNRTFNQYMAEIKASIEELTDKYDSSVTDEELREELKKKADLFEGKVPSTQLPETPSGSIDKSKLDDTLKINESGVLGVNTTDAVEEGNKQPVTSEGVAIVLKSLSESTEDTIIIPSGTNFDTLINDGTYVGGATLGNGTTANFENSPSVVNQSFSIVVSPVGDKGQKKQRLTTCSKTAAKVFERFYYQDTWGEWFCTSDFGTSLLWDGSVSTNSGGSYMNASQTAELSELISKQPNGILLIFSAYADGKAQNYWLNTFFKSKFEVGKHSSAGHSFFLMSGSDFEAVGSKYLYIYDNKITGNSNNSKTGTANGITYANNKFVLRYVVGV